MPDFPVEVITEFLTRLPVDSILRCRCVSKGWCSLIDSKHFIKAHLTHSLKKQSIVFGGGMFTLPLLKVFDQENVVKLLQMPFQNDCFTLLLGSCNGLILLQRNDDICLINPSTRKFVNLPDCPFDFPAKVSDSDDDNDDCVYISKESYGIGYDVINDDYKVIKVVEFTDGEGESLGSKTRFYSHKSNSWGRVRDFPYCLPDFRPLWGANVGGALHTNVVEDNDLIIGFDLSSEEFYLLALPESFDKKFGSMHVMVFDGCLCLLGGYNHHRTDVWVMKEYGAKESWTKLFSIAPPIVNPYISIVPLIYFANRDEVLINYDNNKLILYDLKRKTTRDLLVQNLPNNFYAEVVVESLVPVRGFDVIKKKGKQVKAIGEKHNKKSDGFLSKGFNLKL